MRAVQIISFIVSSFYCSENVDFFLIWTFCMLAYKLFLFCDWHCTVQALV